MEEKMGNNLNIYIAADSIVSSLGFSAQQTFDGILSYQSGIKLDQSGSIADQPIQAAKICSDTLKEQANKYSLTTYTKAEQLIILAVNKLLQQNSIDLGSPDAGMIIATTKGNIDTIQNTADSITESAFLWSIAARISAYYKLEDRVHIISNACISGISALVVAKRLLQSGCYRNVIVVGVDTLSHFITSGFISFKSVSPNPCRPYDEQRDGLSLGEACGSMLLTTDYCTGAAMLYGGAITNDANHISGPSRTGDGLYHAIQGALADAMLTKDDIDYVNLHGTATVYNDEMEAKAIHWAQLQHAMVNSLKSYLGHTLGASGVVETILCIHQLKAGIIFGTLGYENNGVSLPLNISHKHRQTIARTCIKTGSGFGGCNAAIVLSIDSGLGKQKNKAQPEIKSIKHCVVKNSTITVNNNVVLTSYAANFAAFVREAYKSLAENNIKFYKMDDLSKLGYVAASYLLMNEPNVDPCKIGIILANSSASLDTDVKHQQLIDEGGDTLASPAIFVYTLPNVAVGEICIHHKIKGENTFFIAQRYSPQKLKKYAQLAMNDNGLTMCICGWCEFLDGRYEAEFELLKTI